MSGFLAGFVQDFLQDFCRIFAVLWAQFLELLNNDHPVFLRQLQQQYGTITTTYYCSGPHLIIFFPVTHQFMTDWAEWIEKSGRIYNLHALIQIVIFQQLRERLSIENILFKSFKKKIINGCLFTLIRVYTFICSSRISSRHTFLQLSEEIHP